jgi:hypothetical protein
MTRESLWVRHRTTLLIIGGAVAAVAVVILSSGGARTTTPLDPDNPGGDGARAVARVLADQGVDVTVARGAEELEDTPVDAETTVVVTSTELLGRSTTRRLHRHAREADILLVDPGAGLVDALGPSGLPSRVGVGDGRGAACADPLLAGLEVEVDSALEFPGSGCFPGDEGSLVVERGGVTYFGLGQALTNDQVLRADNAAVAVRLLGQDERLVWYVPAVDDLVGNDGVSLQTLLPPWLRPALWLGCLVLLALLLWRARRLGPLATEPLPVVVKAIETTRSRGRLYRRSGDRRHAAEALRAAARHRIAELLQLGETEPSALVRDVARHLDRPEPEVGALLHPAGIPHNDQDLVALASRLAALEKEVRHP